MQPESGQRFLTTATADGVCVKFVEQIKPFIPAMPQPGLTVTVADPDGMVAALEKASILEDDR